MSMHPQKTSIYPNIKQAIVLILLFFLIQFGLLIPVEVFNYIAEVDLSSQKLFLGIIELVAACLILRIGFTRTKSARQEVFPLAPIEPVLFVPIAVTLLGLMLVISEISTTVHYLLPMPDFLTEIFDGRTSKDQSFWETVFYFSLVASLAEELLFRGLILYGFLQNYSVEKAVLWSALLFSLMHLNPWQLVPTFLLGVVFAWWVVRTQSLWPALVGHMLNNGLRVFIYHFDIKIPGITNDFIGEVVFQPWWLSVLGFLLTAGGLWWFGQKTRLRQGMPMDSRRIE